MVSGININLFDFQEKAVIKLLDIVTDSRSKQTVMLQQQLKIKLKQTQLQLQISKLYQQYIT